MQCVILAGGLGTRLYPLTRDIPKALVPVKGKPFADYQLAWLASQGITDIVYCIGHLGDQIVDFVGDGSRWALNVSYVDEGTQLKGTGGALQMALQFASLRDVFFLTYGDSFLPIAYPPIMKVFGQSQKPAMMTVLRNENRWDRSNVIYEPPLVALYDKNCSPETRARMTHIDYGLLVLSRQFVSCRIRPDAVVDLADILGQSSRSGELAGYEVFQRFYEIGSLSGIDDFGRFVEQEGL